MRKHGPGCKIQKISFKSKNEPQSLKQTWNQPWRAQTSHAAQKPAVVVASGFAACPRGSRLMGLGGFLKHFFLKNCYVANWSMFRNTFF